MMQRLTARRERSDRDSGIAGDLDSVGKEL